MKTGDVVLLRRGSEVFSDSHTESTFRPYLIVIAARFGEYIAWYDGDIIKSTHVKNLAQVCEISQINGRC